MGIGQPFVGICAAGLEWRLPRTSQAPLR